MTHAPHRRRTPGWLRIVGLGFGLSLAVAVTPAPDTLTMSHDRVAVVPAPGVLGNDVGIGGNTHAILDSGPTHGTVVLAQNGGYTYTPNAAYVGTDVFHYHPTGCLLFCSQPVTITIRNATPVAAGDSYAAVAGVTK